MKTEIKLPPEFLIALVKDWVRQHIPECLGGIEDVDIKSSYSSVDRVVIELDTKIPRALYTVLEEVSTDPEPTPIPVPYHEPPQGTRDPDPQEPKDAAAPREVVKRKSPFDDSDPPF